MHYTIWHRSYKNERNHVSIILPNGMKCNASFFWFAVELGILNPND